MSAESREQERAREQPQWKRARYIPSGDIQHYCPECMTIIEPGHTHIPRQCQERSPKTQRQCMGSRAHLGNHEVRSVMEMIAGEPGESWS